MAEMTAAQAVEILNGSEKQPQSEQELITSVVAGITRGEKCFVLLWDSERNQIAALIQQQAQQIEAQAREIERLKCCGNCTKHQKHCFPDATKYRDCGFDKCGEWEGEK